MAKLYFGKFSSNYPEQKEEKFYAGGAEGSSWYGGVAPGDYVFPIYKGQVDALWRVREYGQKPNRINKGGVVFFDEVKKFEPIRLTDEFVRYRYFVPDLNLLNKSAKMVQSCGFLPIATAQGCPQYQDIVFRGNLRRFFVVQGDVTLDYALGDVRVLVDEDTNITGIEEFDGSKFNRLEVLWQLYVEKNPTRYSLEDLLKWSRKDDAPNKENYLKSVLAELEEQGHFIAGNPIALYDNILVGRKKTPTPKKATAVEAVEDDVEEAVQEKDLVGYGRYASLLNFNPNLILYGPPGTGKTYATARIITEFERRRTGRELSFADIQKEGRVKFITFHQAYSYEEFIEGIRPVVADDSESESGDASRLKYRIEDGILKQLALAAGREQLKSESQLPDVDKLAETGRVWKVSLGMRNDDSVYKECIKNNIVAVGFTKGNLEGKSSEEIYEHLIKSQDWEQKPTNITHVLNAMVNEMEVGDAVLIYDSPRAIRDIGVVTSDYIYRESNDHCHYRTVTWLKHFKQPLDIFDLNGQKRLTLKSVYELNRLNMNDVLAMLSEENKSSGPTVAAAPYYLIIDEINRGNIAKIFGELITLIEKDKRGTTRVELPYSKKPFTLPPNLFIIGTMNTADRSIAILDTALRRRFSFVEIEPSLDVFNLPSVTAKINDTIDLPQLLEKLNKDITEKLDRDHRIGHSYFMEIVTLDDLYNTWYYKILPLLTEYFYNDLNSLRAIIGDKFYTEYGSVNFLSKKGHSGQPSEFEKALLELYRG